VQTAQRQGPLSGIHVLDLTTYLSGPYCTYFLAQMGADVLKVEPPSGDRLRFIPPARHRGMGGPFLSVNQHKRGVVIDLQTEEGQNHLRRLASTADVVVHNMRRKAAEGLGLTYEELRPLNPRLILCRIVGYGQGGPYADLPAFDDPIQGATGMAYLQQDREGRPQYMASAIADKVAGMFAVIAILGALVERNASGVGQEVEVPMFECLASFMLAEHIGGRIFDPPLGPAVFERVLPSIRRPFATRDGFIAALVYTDGQWQRFVGLCGRQDLLTDPAFATVERRARHYPRLYQILQEVFATKTTREWLTLLWEADVPAMPVLSPDDLFSDPHLQAVGFFKAVEHPTEGRLLLPRFPLLFSRTPAREPGPAPPFPGQGKAAPPGGEGPRDNTK